MGSAAIRREGRRSPLFARADRGGERVVVVRRCGQDTVDDDVLAGQADRGEFTVGAGDLGKGRRLGAGHQHEAGALRVGQRRDRVGVDGALLVQTGQRSQAGCVALAFVEELGPRAGQLQQPDGVPGRGGVEQDVVELRRSDRRNR